MKKLSVFFSAFAAICIALSGCRPAAITVMLDDFIPSDTEITDHTPYFRAALDKCREMKASRLTISEGVYHFRPDKAYERYVFMSNNDEGLKRLLFDLTDMSDFEIEGNGAELIFTGFISPFLLNNSRNITISGLSIDYSRTFHSEGVVETSGKDWIDVRFPENFPYDIRNGLLTFKDNEGTLYPSSNMLEFDAVKREPAYRASDYWIWGGIKAVQNNDGSVRVFQDNVRATPGNIMVFGAGRRQNPGFSISDSHNVLIKNVTIYHCGGMGFIAQRSADIELNGVKVTPSVGRVVSASADATHYSNCSGYIRMIDCLFENQKDDATNIHGIYAMIAEMPEPDRMIVRFMHSQQYGFDFIEKGTVLEFVDHRSLITRGTAKVRNVSRLNKEYTEVELEAPIPAGTVIKDVVAQTDHYPDVLIKGCTISKNRARGILLGSRGQIVIEDNYFHTPGAAILLEGDGSYWYEQAGVRDLTIRNNVFENCMYGYRNWGSACIACGNRIAEGKDISRYNRNVTVEGNTFRGFDPRIMNLYCTDGISFANNRIEKTEDYPMDTADMESFVFTDCDNVHMEE